MGSVTLRYLGHCCFAWTSPAGQSVVVDPFDNRQGMENPWFAAPAAPPPAAIALVTHAHFDHDAVHCLAGTPTIVRDHAVQVGLHDVAVHGVVDEHVAGHWPPEMTNVMFALDIGGIRFCHFGDNRPMMPAEVRRALGDIDVLMVTVDDSCHLLTFDEVASVIDTLDPRVVIPMHYAHDAISHPRSLLRTIDTWLTRQYSVRELGVDNVTISPDDLPETREVWVMKPSPIGGPRAG